LLAKISTNHVLTDKIKEITLGVRGLESVARIRAGAHITVHLPQPDGGSAPRIYSIWRQSAGGAQLTIRVLLHPRGGPGTSWARTAQPGDEVAIGPPQSKLTLDQRAGFHVFLGDENGAVPLLAMRGRLAADAAVYGAFQALGRDFRVPAPPGVPELPWLDEPHPAMSPPAGFPVLAAARALELPAGAGCVYVAGEANLCKSVLRHFVEERGWPRAAVRSQPQWLAGRTGFGVGPSR